MNAGEIISLVASGLLCAYLVYVLLRGENL